MPQIVKNIPPMDLMSFLIESVDSPTHVGMLQVFEPVNGDSKEIVERVLHAYRTSEVGPPFNYYPVFPRFGMPKWAKAERFDAAYHIRHIAVPSPGTDRQVIDLAMDLHAGMMDRSRPGWIAYVIEGLEDDCFALYWKVHHAYIDGASAVIRMDAAMSRTADDLEVRPMWAPLPNEAPESGGGPQSLGELLNQTTQGLGTQAKAFGEVALSLGRSLRQASGQIQREAPLPFSAPKSLFNQPVHATRSLGVGSAELQRFKRLAKQEQVSINEIALTLVGEALDRYAENSTSKSDKQLVATCPMAVRKEGDTAASTQIAAISVKLGNASMTIQERLAQVAASSKDAKEEAKTMSREALMNYLILLGGAATLASKTALADYVPPLTSVNVSNVAGPKYRCHLSGAELVRSYPLSTLAGGTAVNITLTSFSGRMDFAVIADAITVPQAQDIADLMIDALDQLEQATAEKRPRKQPKKSLKKKSKPKHAS